VDQYLERSDARIAYDSAGPVGAEHTLVVAHSLATSRAWEDEAGILQWGPVTESGHRLIRFDSRGHGESSGRAVAEEYAWPSLAEDLVAICDAVSPDRPVDGLGESTGCGVLLRAVLAKPRRFRRLVLVIPPTMGSERAEQAELYTAAASMIDLRGAGSWERILTSAAPAPILQLGGWTRPSWVPVRDELIPSVLRGAAASTFPLDEELRTVRQSVLILTWDTDPSHPLTTAEHLAEQLPDSVLEVATSPDEIRSWAGRAAAFLRD
jgi:3-oxoadipate enol-lactonase